MSKFNLRRLAFASLLLWSFGALAEHYTIPLLVSAQTTGAPQGVLRILNGTDESGMVEIYAIDDAGTRSGPATFTLNASAAVEFTATDLQSGNATLGLTGGIGTDVGDARLEIETDLSIVPLAFVRAADGTLSAMHDTVRGASVGGSDGYTYGVPIFNPSSDVTQVSRLRLINPGDASASVTIAGRDNSGFAATGGDVTLTLAAGGAQTLTAQQLEAGATGLTGRLGAGTGKWRLTVSSDRPLQVVNFVAASAGYWNNLSTTAVPGAAPADREAFNGRFVDRGFVYRTDSGETTFTAEVGDRFTETGESDAMAVFDTGSYAYEAIGPDAGLLTVSYDDNDECEANLYFSSLTRGWFASRCTGRGDPYGYWVAGNWSVADEAHDAVTLGVEEALSGVPASGVFVPPVLVGVASFSAAARGTTIALNNHGYFDLSNGTRYTCTSAAGCVIENTTVIRGAIAGTAAGTGELDTFPTFRTATALGNRTNTAGTAIDTLTLPEASGGDGTLTYSLSPNVPGLSFDAATRRLAGTPTAAASYATTYTVTDSDGDTDALRFTLTVAEADDGNGSEVPEFELHNDNNWPKGIAYANDRLFVVDSFDGKIYAYGDDGQRDATAEFDLHEDNDSPEGIAYANDRFHVVDLIDGKVYAYGDDGQRDATAEFDLHDDNDDPRGIVHVNDRFYVVDWFDERVFVYRDTGQRDTAAEFDLHADNTIPWGIAHANDRFYVVDEFDAKVYAYRAVGQRDAVADFDLHDDNVYAAGIVHANGRFYVVDWLGKVYAYPDAGTAPAPDLGSTDPDDRTYRVGMAIDALTLPEAGGGDGDGTLTYSLSPDVPGLSFNAATRRLTGTPTVAGTYSMTYTVTDADGDTDSLSFTIAVEASEDDGDGAIDYGVDDTLPGVPRSGVFVPSVLSGGSVSATAGGTTVALDEGGYFELSDGTRYTCRSSDGCVIEDGTVNRGAVAGTAADTGEIDRFPTFRNATAPGNRTYSVGTAIETLELPEASSGNGTLMYSLSPNVRGLSFDAAMHQLSGTPATAGTYLMIYTVTDEDGDTGMLAFTIVVEGVGVGDDSEVTIFGLHAQNASPSGVTYADGRIYVVDDWFDDKIYAYMVTGLRDATAEFDLHAENASPVGIAYAGGRFYVMDGIDRKVYAYGADGQRDTTVEFDLHADNSSPKGIAFADDLFYVVDWFDDKVYAYGADGQRDTTVEFDLHGNNGSPWGIEFANKRYYVVDTTTGVYAYGPSGQRDAPAGFDLHGDNGLPRGIAYANGRFYVANWTERRIYGYWGNPGSGTATAYETGATVATMPTGAWVPDRISGGSATIHGETVVIDLDDGGIFESGFLRYTCESTQGCRIDGGMVTTGRIVETSVGAAAADQGAFDNRFVGNSFRTGSYHVDFESAGRFIEDGKFAGSYSYANTGPDTGTLTLTYDGGRYGGSCAIQIAFATESGGASRFTCHSGALGQSAWRLVAIGAPILTARSDSATALVVSFIDSFEAGETRAYDVQVRTRTLGASWEEVCEEITARERGTRRVTLTVSDLEPETAYEVRYRYRNSSSCDTGTLNQWSPVDVGTTGTGLRPGFVEGTSTTRTIPENLPSGINVGEPVWATGGTLSYTLGGTDAGSFDIVSDSGQIRTAENIIYDYELKNEYRVNVGVMTERGNRDSIEVTIKLLDLIPACGASDELNLRTHAGNRRLTLRWNPVQHTGAEQGVVGYETGIRRGATAEWADRRTFLGRNFTHMIYADLDNEIGYQVRVRPINAEGTCGWSTPVSGAPTEDLAPADSDAQFDRFATRPVGTDERHIRFLTPQRCRHASGGVTAEADCRYEKTGPVTGSIVLEFDDPSRGSCEVSMAYSSLTAGSFIDECFDAGVNTDVPFDTSFRMPRPTPQNEDDPDPPPPESEPQRAPRDQEELDALVHGMDDFIPGLCFGYCGLLGLSRSDALHSGVATQVSYEQGRTIYGYGDYTYRNTGPSGGIVSLRMRHSGEVWSFTLDFEPSGNIRVTITPPGGGAHVWPGMTHLDLTLGRQPVLLPIPPSWSAAIAVENDVAPVDVDGLHELAHGTCANDVEPAMCALLGDVWDRAFVGPDGQDTLALVHDHSYRKVGRNRGMVTVTWALSDGFSRSDLARFQMELFGSTWVFDLTFTSDGAAKVVLTSAKDGHLPSVEEGFVDFVGDGIVLDAFPDEVLPPDDPPQASGEDISGVEVAAAVTSRTIGTDDVQTFLVSDTGATYRPGDWLEPKDGSNQRMMIVDAGQTAGVTAIGFDLNAPDASSAARRFLMPAQVDGLMTLSVVCMQVSGTVPVRGARYFSRPKSPETAVQRCQLDCVLAGGGAIQGCVWRCEETAVGSASVPQLSGDFSIAQIRGESATLDERGRNASVPGELGTLHPTHPTDVFDKR